MPTNDSLDDLHKPAPVLSIEAIICILSLVTIFVIAAVGYAMFMATSSIGKDIGELKGDTKIFLEMTARNGALVDRLVNEYTQMKSDEAALNEKIESYKNQTNNQLDVLKSVVIPPKPQRK